MRGALFSHAIRLHGVVLSWSTGTNLPLHYLTLNILQITRAVWKVRGLAAVRRCYAEGSCDCYAKLQWWG